MQPGVGELKTMQEFFAGSGLVAEGLKDTFATVWANDISPQKAAVYRANRGDDAFLLDDIKNVKGSDVPAAQLAWASFPCQDLSLAGNMAGIHASRSGLVWEFLRVLDEMPVRPRVLLLENVMGLLTTKAGYNYKVVHKALLERGYRCGAVTLNADRFVPQSRPRVFIIAVDSRAPIPDELVGEGPNWLHNGAASSIVNLDDNVKYLVINTKDVKGVGNEADLEKAAETGTTNQYFANVTYYTETAGGDAVLVVIDSTGKWYPNGSDTATTVTEVPAP